MGLAFNDNNYANAKVRANFNSSSFNNLPLSYSLRQYCPKPGNQLQLNTSPAWATAWSALSILEAQQNDILESELITRNAFSPIYLYQNIRITNNENCEALVELQKALEFLKYHKVKKHDSIHEFCPKELPPDLLPDDEGMISDYRKLFDNHHSKNYKTNTVKKSISENLPVVIGMYCPPSFFNAQFFWQPMEIMNTDYPGHAMCVVGYDDQKYGGAFEVINSWGSEWGNKGFIWIKYEDFVEFTKYAYEIFKISSDKNKDQLAGSIELKIKY